MATVYEIVQGLSQAAANAYDGALGEDNEPIVAGLRREDGDPIPVFWRAPGNNLSPEQL